MPANLLNNLKRAVVIAMIAVRMMKASLYQVVNMVIMRNRRVPAVGAVNMVFRMFSGGKSGSAFVRIGRINGNRVFVHMIAVRMMEMAVMKIIHMSFMFDGRVSAARGMDVRMVRMSRAMIFAHNFNTFYVRAF
jgi:hypothetical protein